MAVDQLKVKLIRDLIDVHNVARVKLAMKIGKELLILKAEVGHGNWMDFVKENFGMSLRSCQDYMRLNKIPVNEKYYSLGLAKINNMIDDGIDLSA